MPLGLRSRGFTTLVAASCLLGITVTVAVVAEQFRNTMAEEARALSLAQVDHALRAHLALVLDQDLPRVEGVPGLPAGFQATSEDLSGRLNLNTVPEKLLLAGSLSGVFLRDPGEWRAYREASGPFTHLSGFAGWINDQALTELFRAESLVNVNVGDPTMVAKMAVVRTGKAEIQSSLQAQLRSLQGQNQTVGADQLDFLLGSDRDTLTPLLGVEAELNVALVPDSVLDALVLGMGWKIPEAGTKLAMLKQERRSGTMTMARLRSLFGLPANHPLFSYLGVRSREFRITYRGPTESYRYLVLDDAEGEIPHWRIVSREVVD
jgi:hypothetical protein